MPDPIQADPGAGADPQNPAPGGGQIEPGQQQPAGGAAPETFTVDGQTLTADQVRDALKAKADYDQFQPEFTRRSQLLSNPDQLLEHARKQWPDRFPATPAAPVTPDEQQLQEAIAMLRSKGDFVTREEAVKAARAELDRERADTALKAESEALTKEWDGANGKPKFDMKAVAQYAYEHGHPNLTSAFREMHFDALREWYATQKPKPNAPVVAGPGGNSVPVAPPKKVRLDDDSFDQAFEEAFGK